MHPQSTQLPLPEESWLPVVSYEGLYEVSDLGNVRNVRRRKSTWPGRVLKPRLYTSGHLHVHLCREGQATALLIHRLVLAAFTRPAARQQEGNHINGVKADNRLINLEWITHAGNARHAFTTGLSPKGESRSQAKLTEADVRAIRAARGTLSQRTLARQFGVDQSVICEIQCRKCWKHV